MRKLRIGILFALYLVLLISIFTKSIQFLRIEYEITSKPSIIRDGDTFEIPDHPAIRLADIQCPEYDEPGGPEARFALTQLINDKTVYLDLDNLHRFDTTGTRYVCLVYVDHNSTHFLNVNQALVVLGQAIIDDYENQWNPYTWSLYVAKPSNRTILLSLGASAILSLIIILGLNWMLSIIYIKIRKIGSRILG